MSSQPGMGMSTGFSGNQSYDPMFESVRLDQASAEPKASSNLDVRQSGQIWIPADFGGNQSYQPMMSSQADKEALPVIFPDFANRHQSVSLTGMDQNMIGSSFRSLQISRFD